MTNLFSTDLDEGLAHIRRSPADVGTLDMIVRRPSVGTREVVEVAELDTVVGLVGDSWATRERVDPEAQLNVMNARMAALLAPDEHGRALAGDQLYLDIDFTEANLPAGTRLQIGDAVIEITAKPHTGCKKFAARFGAEMTRFVNTGEGKRLRLRGVCAKVVRGGAIRRGDTVTKL
ncbi:MAG TPA: MOSC domain-containing protein [Acidimicrobiales bacterium]|nr:MOSC domain-containing protein [Acidimicrobiales bacterium]